MVKQGNPVFPAEPASTAILFFCYSVIVSTNVLLNQSFYYSFKKLLLFQQCSNCIAVHMKFLLFLGTRVVVDHRNMTDFGHGFFRLYSRGRRSKMVIKTLKKTSKSVRRYMKSWGLKKFFKKFFFSDTPRNQIKKLDPPLPLP